MEDLEKMIQEDDYKQNHIFLWEFVINRIKDASLLISDKKDVSIHKVKEEYLQKVKARLEEKEFLNAKDKWLLKKINKGMQNDCWACQYVLDESCRGDCFTACPLLENHRGKLRHNCIFWCSNYSLLKIALEEHDYEKALKLATEIKDAWREVK